MTRSTIAALGVALALTAAPAVADEAADKPFPRIDGEVLVELGGDYARDEDGVRTNDTYPTIEMGVGWLFTPSLSVQGSFIFEPVFDPDAGESRAFDDLALYVEEIYGQYERGPFRLFAGKYNPTFGVAWDKAPGVYGVDMAEDYQLTERIGLGGAASAATGFGKHTLTAGSFFVDTTSLSDSFGARRGMTGRADGGAGNTETLNNWSVTLDGEDLFGLQGLGYHAGYRYQAKGVDIDIDEDGTDDPAHDEAGYVAGLFGEHEVGPFTLGWIAEYAAVRNFEGVENADKRWFTVGGSLAFDRYNAAVSYTLRDTDLSLAGDAADDYQLAFSVGTEIHDGWTADIGYKLLEEEDQRVDTVGFRLGKTFAFSSAE